MIPRNGAKSSRSSAIVFGCLPTINVKNLALLSDYPRTGDILEGEIRRASPLRNSLTHRHEHCGPIDAPARSLDCAGFMRGYAGFNTELQTRLDADPIARLG